MYRGAVRMVITYILPAVLITNTPALALLGKWRAWAALAALVVSLLFLWIARRFWRFALRFYTGAGG